jgi:hypothetical protein
MFIVVSNVCEISEISYDKYLQVQTDHALEALVRSKSDSVVTDPILADATQEVSLCFTSV